MYDPGTAAIIGMITSVAGTVYGAVSSYQAGEYNAKVAEQNAKAQEAQAKLEETAHRRKLASLMSKQRAMYAASGVDTDTGSPSTVLQETISEGTLDALAIRYGGDVRASRSRSEGRLAKMQGRASLISGLGRAAGGFAADYGDYRKRF